MKTTIATARERELIQAEFERAQNTVEWANKRVYNWTPLIDFATTHDDPANVAKALKLIFYEFTNHLILSGDYAQSGDMACSMYYLRCIIEAFEDMEDHQGFIEFALREQECDEIEY